MSGTRATAQATGHVGRNDPCPCGSGRKFKLCCHGKPGGIARQAQPARPPVASPDTLRALFASAKRSWDAGRWTEAIAPLQEIVRLDPNSPQAYHDLGVTFLRCGRVDEASASLQRAVALRPGFAGALGHLAYALEQEPRPQEAVTAYRSASRAADDPILRDHYLAKALVIEGRLDEAEQALRRSLNRAPRHVGSHYLLGHVLSQRGRFAEAVACLAQAIELAPEETYAFEELTTAKRITEPDRVLIDRMRDLAGRPGLDTMARISLAFGLGKACDDLGDPSEAIQHYDAANRLKAESLRLDRPELVKQFDNLIAGFTAAALEQAAAALARPVAPGDDMPVLIVGMPRSGTTLVEQVLSSHPAVGAGGELGFWKERLDGWHTSRRGSVEAPAMAQAAADYRDLLRRIAPGAARVTDKMPGNFVRLWLVRLAFPHARIIHCRRHPVDTCLSIFFTHFQGRQEYAYDRGDLVFYYRQYLRLMQHWRNVLPPDRFTEVDYERLVTDREAETRRLVDFCDLGWDDACLAPERNTRVVTTASRWQARQPVYASSMERWRRYEPWLGELRELLSVSAPASTNPVPA